MRWLKHGWPLVSILVAYYRNGDYIYETISSICKQTYGNIELVVGDDASPGFDAEKVRRYIDAHKGDNISNVIILSNAENLGTVANVENMIHASHGECVTFMAGDDCYADKDAIKWLMEPLIADESLFITFGNTVMCDAKLKEKHYLLTSEENIRLVNTATKDDLFVALSLQCFLPAMGGMYRRTVFDRIGQLSDTYRYVEDWPMHLRCARLRMNMMYLPIVACLHRDGGISHGATKLGQRLAVLFWRDMVRVMELEILPYIESFAAEKKEQVANRYLRFLHEVKEAEEKVRLDERNQQQEEETPQQTTANEQLNAGEGAHSKGSESKKLSHLKHRLLRFLELKDKLIEISNILSVAILTALMLLIHFQARESAFYASRRLYCLLVLHCCCSCSLY